MTQFIFTSKVTVAHMGHQSGVTCLAFSERVETELGTDTVPGATIRQPGETLSTRAAP